MDLAAEISAKEGQVGRLDHEMSVLQNNFCRAFAVELADALPPIARKLGEDQHVVTNAIRKEGVANLVRDIQAEVLRLKSQGASSLANASALWDPTKEYLATKGTEKAVQLFRKLQPLIVWRLAMAISRVLEPFGTILQSYGYKTGAEYGWENPTVLADITCISATYQIYQEFCRLAGERRRAVVELDRLIQQRSISTAKVLWQNAVKH
jgi:hypothetical protein